MLKKIFLLIILNIICACNLQVMYKDGDSKNTENSEISYAHELAAIIIKKDRIRSNQELKNNLYDILNPDYLKVEPKYFLIIELSSETSSAFTTSTGSSGRNSVNLVATYTLKDLKTAKNLATGYTRASDNYDVTTNRFGSYSAEEYIRSNLTKIVAQNIRNSLVNDIIEMKKKKDRREKKAKIRRGEKEILEEEVLEEDTLEADILEEDILEEETRERPKSRAKNHPSANSGLAIEPTSKKSHPKSS